VATSDLLGVSTRRVEKLIQQLGITSLSKSQASEMARDLDAQVEAPRTRPLDAGPHTFVAADALVVKVREAGRTVNVHPLLATGVNAEGYREILGPAGHLGRGRGQPDGRHPEDGVGRRPGAAALGLRPARRRRRAGTVRPDLDSLSEKLPQVAAHLDAARPSPA
jgi:hypothetical protein